MTGTELLIAAAIDVVMGDPRWFPHPVRGMGRVIAWCDEHVRLAWQSSVGLRLAGIVLACGLPAAVYGFSSVVIEWATGISVLAGRAVEIGLASTTLAWRDLWDHAQGVSRPLLAGNVADARSAVAKIVGRDTESLSESEVVRATVETIAESTADGVVAPLLYLSLGGAPFALAYKAVNTLDSMIGHREERYRDFGWASARLDDVANWLPARLTSWFIVLAAWACTKRWEQAIESRNILLRDAEKHPSPNSGRPEAAMAGALGVQLGGVNCYDGIAQERPIMGEGRSALYPGDIERAMWIMTIASLLCLLLALISLWVA